MQHSRIGDLNGKWALAFKLWCVLFPIAVALQTGFMGWIGSMVVSHEKQLATIDASKWTTKEQAVFQSTLANQFTVIRTDLSNIQASVVKLAALLPSTDIMRRLDVLENRVERMEHDPR